MLRSVTSKTVSNQFKRTLATAAAAPKAEVTQLSNGIVVATEHNPSAHTASIGVVFGSGAANENPYNNGVSNLWKNIFLSRGNSAMAEKEGLALSSSVSRDFQSYIVSSLPGSTAKSLDFLNQSFIQQRANLLSSDFEATKKSVLKQVQDFEENDHPNRVLEHLHSTAFQNTPLSLPTRGTVESLENLVVSDLESFANNHFLNSNAVIVGTGNIKHEDLVNSIESKNLGLKNGTKPVLKKKATFLGSEVRLRDDTLPKAWISLAVEGEPVNSPQFFVAKLAAQIFGSYNAFEPASRLQGIKLLDNIQEYQLCDSFNHFSLSYKDSGLWGFSTATRSVTAIDDLIHFTLKQWNRLTISVTDTEVERAKSLLKVHLGQLYESGNPANDANLLGAEVLVKGSKLSLTEAFKKIDAITVKDVKAWASKRLWDQDIAIAGTGQIEGLLDYMRIRSDMSMMRW
ncbi:cor1p [Saccharomyces arboricola H-6]|uniref:Cor1p n=1 Tax=Saccharomyces arboricola (strain H-6 / AS 2.3317 / CBS 10644) TaxID=1160507 RepID=J8Q7Q0_SACAR|nr:cor1p [Saccharomyces arboricola H-6]